MWANSMATSFGKQTGRQVVEVQIFHEQGKHTLVIPQRCTAKYLHELLSKEIGLNPESAQLFALFTGNLGTPSKLLQEDDTVPAQQPLCFQRWCFDANLEAKAIRHDDAAVHLLYNECQHYLRTGSIKPTPSQAQELEELSDPLFPTERQFLKCARGVEGYSDSAANDCKVLTEVQSNTYAIRQGDNVRCMVGWDALSVCNSTVKAVWLWNAVRSWNTPSPNVVQFEVCVHMQNAPIMRRLSLETSQAHFLVSSASTICHTRAGISLPSSQSTDSKQPAPANPFSGFLNVYFDVKQFSSIEDD